MVNAPDPPPRAPIDANRPWPGVGCRPHLDLGAIRPRCLPPPY